MDSGVRIISDGTAEGTHVYVDGKEVHDVTNVTWVFSPDKRKTQVTLEISNVAIDAASEISPEARAVVDSLIQN